MIEHAAGRPRPSRRLLAGLSIALLLTGALALSSASTAAASFFATTATITAADPTQSERPTRDLIQDTCQFSDFDGTSGFGLLFHYDLYAFANRSDSALCVRVTMTLQPPCAINDVHSAAYIPSFVPTAIATNFVGSGDAGVWSFNVPAHSPFELDVHETTPDLGCSSYSLDLNTDKHFNLKAPSISGSAVIGAVLTADSGTWAGANGGVPPTEFAYRWQRCTTTAAACVDIGAPGASYQVTAADAGSTLRALVTAGPAGPTQNSAATALTDPIAGPLPAATPPLPALPLTRPADRADFTHSPTILRVSPAGRFTYTFKATPGRVGSAELTSTRAIRTAAAGRHLKLGPRSFSVAATGDVTLAFKLTHPALRALRRTGAIAFTVRVIVGASSFTTTLRLRPPRHGPSRRDTTRRCGPCRSTTSGGQ